MLADQRIGFDADDGGIGITENDRSPLTSKRKTSVIQKMKKFTPFKGRASTKKRQMELFDSQSSLDFDISALDDNGNDAAAAAVEDAKMDDTAAGGGEADFETPANSTDGPKTESTADENDDNNSVDGDDNSNSLGSLTAYQQGEDVQQEAQDRSASEAIPAPPVSRRISDESKEMIPKPPRPRKPSSTSAMIKSPVSPPGSPSASARMSPSSARKPSSLRKRTSSSGSGYSTPASTDSPISNSRNGSPRVSWHKAPTLTAAESPTVSTKSSVASSGGDMSPVPTQLDNPKNESNGQAESSSGRTEESWKRLSEAFGNDDGGMGGYFSKLQEKATTIGEDPAVNDGKTEQLSGETQVEKKGGGSRSRIKKLFGLNRSPTKSSPKPKGLSEKLQSVDPNLVMEELNSMLVTGTTSEPITRTKSLRMERTSDDVSEACSVEFPEIPTKKEMSLEDIRKEVTWRRERTSINDTKPTKAPVQNETSGEDDGRKEVSWRRERTVRKTKSESKSSSDGSRNQSRRSSTRQVSSRRIRSSSDDGMDATGKPRSRRRISEHKDEDDTGASRSSRKEAEASKTEESATTTSHRRHRTSKTHDKSSSRRSHGDAKVSDHTSSSHSNRRRPGIRRSSSDDGIKVVSSESSDHKNESGGLRRRSSRRPETSTGDKEKTVEENESSAKTKAVDGCSKESDESKKSRAGHRHGSSSSSERRSLGQQKDEKHRSSQSSEREATKSSAPSSRSADSKRRSSDNSGKRRRHHGHHKIAAREGKSETDSKSPTRRDSGHGVTKPSSMSQIRSLFADDMGIDKALSNSEGALNYNHEDDGNAVSETAEIGDEQPSEQEKEDVLRLSSPRRSQSTHRRSNPRSAFVRSLSLSSMGKSTPGRPFGSKNTTSARRSTSRRSQLQSVDEKSEDVPITTESEKETNLFDNTVTTAFEQETSLFDNVAVEQNDVFQEDGQKDHNNGFEDCDDSDNGDDDDELGELNVAPRSSMSLAEALDRESAMHGRLFDDDGQQTVITDDGSLWLHEDGTAAVSKIRSSASVCAPQLDFCAPTERGTKSALGVRNLQ
jgi:hypothetical protein